MSNTLITHGKREPFQISFIRLNRLYPLKVLQILLQNKVFNIYIAGDAVANIAKETQTWVVLTKAEENSDWKFHFMLLID